MRRDSIPRRAGLLGEPKKINHPALLETTRSGIFFVRYTIVPNLGLSDLETRSEACIRLVSPGAQL